MFDILCSSCLQDDTFNIFQVYQYFTIYRQYFFLKFEHFSLIFYATLWYTEVPVTIFKWVKVSGSALYWKAWLWL